MEEELTKLDLATWILGVIGGLNWGLVGALDFNLVDTLLGAGSMLARLVYILVGLSALYSLWYLIQCLSGK